MYLNFDNTIDYNFRANYRFMYIDEKQYDHI